MTAALPRARRTALCAATFAVALGCRAPEPAHSAAQPSRDEDSRLSFERGKELALHGESLRAEQYLARALERGHDPPETLRWLIGACVDGSRLRAAIHYARPYVEAHPDALRLRYVVATLYLGLGQPLPARQHLRDIVQRAPGWADARDLLDLVEAQLAQRAVVTR
jgi:hypothetical protein